MKRRKSINMVVARLLKQADNPESKKLKTGELAAAMDDCIGAVVSEDVGANDRNIAMATPMRAPESIRKSKTVVDRQVGGARRR